jgi:hypothetical protein
LQDALRNLKQSSISRQSGRYKLFARSLLKLGNVEDWVNSRFSRQIELIGNGSHFLKHNKGPKELEC